MQPSVVAYVPVLHEGYWQFFGKHKDSGTLYILGRSITEQYKPLTKEIRQLEPAVMQKAIESLHIFARVEILEEAGLAALNRASSEIILPDEDVSRDIAEKYLSNAHVTFDKVFLRWDKKNAKEEKDFIPDKQVTYEEFHRHVMARAEQESEKSSDIWRHVGAAIVKNGEVVLVAYNRHIPSPHSPYVNGDPRSNWSQGVEMELATGFHAEASIVAEAARRGIALEGTDMYVTVFPCPPCSKIVAYSGIKNLYVGGGRAILDAEEVIKGKGIEIIFVE